MGDKDVGGEDIYEDMRRDEGGKIQTQNRPALVSVREGRENIPLSRVSIEANS